MNSIPEIPVGSNKWDIIVEGGIVIKGARGYREALDGQIPVLSLAVWM